MYTGMYAMHVSNKKKPHTRTRTRTQVSQPPSVTLLLLKVVAQLLQVRHVILHQVDLLADLALDQLVRVVGLEVERDVVEELQRLVTRGAQLTVAPEQGEQLGAWERKSREA